jgi:hypothetical protein
MAQAAADLRAARSPERGPRFAGLIVHDRHRCIVDRIGLLCPNLG